MLNNKQALSNEVILRAFCRLDNYNAFNVYCRELAPGTVSLTGYRAQGDDIKHCAYFTVFAKMLWYNDTVIFEYNHTSI